MVEWPVPKTLKSLRRFLGLTDYYRKFIKGHASIATPLTELLKKKSFSWNARAEAAFEWLKTAINPPVLRLPDFNRPFTIECDASSVGLRVVLMQEAQPIAFYSKTLKVLLLSTYEKELLALVLSVQRWRPYLLGHPFRIKTNQQALKFLVEQKIGTETQQQWVSKLIGYDFGVDYKKGKENLVAHALSRKNEEQVVLVVISFPTSLWIDELKGSYSLCPKTLDIITKL